MSTLRTSSSAGLSEAPGATTRSVVITGGGAGIGREVAKVFAANDWAVHITGRTETTLAETAQIVADTVRTADSAAVSSPTATPNHAIPISYSACDVADVNGMAKVFDGVVKRFGRLDAVIINAGLPGLTAELGEVPLDAFQQTVQTNLVGGFVTAREAFRVMKEQRPQGGRILINCSIAAQVPRPHTAPYAASKAGLAGLARVISLDGRPYGISATRIDIGNAATELLGSFTGSEPMFHASDAASAFYFAANLPTNATVDHLTVTAQGMPFLGRG